MIQGTKDTFTLNNGVKMPMLGLGVWLAEDSDELITAIQAAAEAGYIHIDTASGYGNEEAVGKGIRKAGFRREEIFVTTKLSPYDSGRGRQGVQEGIDGSLKRLGMDYVDLYLIHWPINVDDLFIEAWRNMIEAVYKSGKARAIGVSNFKIHHMESVIKETGVVPMVNQIELHPWMSRKDVLAYCNSHGILLEAYSPIMHGRLSQELGLLMLAKKYNKTPAQMVLRWDLQNGVCVIPKSVHAERIRENADLYDFELDMRDMFYIDSLNRNQQFLHDSDTVNNGKGHDFYKHP